MVAHTRSATHHFRDVQSPLKQLREDDPGPLCHPRRTIRHLHLPEDLRLAKHQRIQAGGNPKEMAHRLDVVPLVQVGDKLGLWQPMIGRQKIDTTAHPRLGIRPLQIALHPVTGRKNYHFFHRRVVPPGKRLRQRLVRKGQVFTHGHWSRFMV